MTPAAPGEAEREPADSASTRDRLNAMSAGYLPGLLGIDVLEARAGRVVTQLVVRPELMAPNGFLHAGTVIGLADTTCGYGSFSSLPEGAFSFTTIELKANFLGTARGGVVRCEAVLVHGGRTTQVWDATVCDASGAPVIALFRCTQLLLYPRPSS